MPSNSILVVMPVFNDWAACGHLLAVLDEVLFHNSLSAAILVVDDGSTALMPETFGRCECRAISRIDVLRLRRNLGHQRAICAGLSYVDTHEDHACDTVVLMDADGEDDPRDVPRLLAKCREEGGRKIVFAERTRRSESFAFRLCYAVFRLLHWLLTSHGVRVGNYSAIPRAQLRSLTVASELWNHYASAVRACKLPQCAIPTARGKRLAGQGRMNFISLVIHGLSAISVFSDVLGVRLLLTTLLLAAVAMAGVSAVVALRLLTNLAIPGWATSTVGILLIVLLQTIILAVTFSFMILASREGARFLPARDCGILVDRIDTVYSKSV